MLARLGSKLMIEDIAACLRLGDLDDRIAGLRSAQAAASRRGPHHARELGEAGVILEGERLTILWELKA